MKLRMLVIVGPTASGKTRLGVELAHRLGSEIVSADSRQVYTGLDLGTGKDLEEYFRVQPPVPYHLIDIVGPETIYTLFDYQTDCYRILDQLAAQTPFTRGATPLLMVGGSGLYVEAVLRRYEIPDVPENPELRQELAEEALPHLIDRLRRESPSLHARTDLSSAKRVIRALEISAAARAGQRIEPEQGLEPEVEYRVFAIKVERDILAHRIERRLHERLEMGMVDEVSSLLEQGLPAARLKMLGMEYREIGAFLAGEKSHGQMVEDLAREIRRLAKRQQTYFRGMERRGVSMTWIQHDDYDTALDTLHSGPWSGIPPS